MPTHPAPSTPPHSTGGSPFAAIRALFRNSRVQYLPLPGWVARFLSLYGMVGMLGYYTLKQFFAPEHPWLVTIGGPLLITAAIAHTLVIGSTYSFIAFASRKDIDERELAERNAAFAFSFKYVINVLLVTHIAGLVATRYGGWQPTITHVENFFVVIVFTGLAMPATVMAWRERRIPAQDLA